MTRDDPFVRKHLAASLVLTLATAVGSYAYFHIDEYFQVLELARWKLGLVEAWALPWEHAERMRPWLQPAAYVVVGKALGASARDPFTFGLACRLVTGAVSWAAVARFLRATLSLVADEDAQRLHVRVLTLAGFLPYLLVRTSSETASLAALTTAVAVLLEGCVADGEIAWRGRALRLACCGALLGIAFEMRFQTAIAAAGILAWVAFVARAGLRACAALACGGVAVVVVAALVDAWGYGAPCFPPLAYARTNLLEGAASLFGADPPFAYVWMSPANVFLPVVALLLVLVPIAWWRAPRHPLTWATLPFVVVHNLLSHKEERFLFPVAVLALGLVSVAIAPAAGRPLAIASRLWAMRSGVLARGVAAWSTAMMLVLAVWPLGWHHHVRFAKHAWTVFGDDLHVAALPDFDLGLPAYHGRTYDVEKLPAEELARRIDAGTARAWLVADTPVLDAPTLAGRATLAWSELPLWDDPVWGPRLFAIAEAYDARARAPLKPLRFRSLYRLGAAAH